LQKKLIPTWSVPVLFIILALGACDRRRISSAADLDTLDVSLHNLTLGLSFPPVSDAESRAFTSVHLEELDVHLIRFAENWAYREPRQGEYRWTALDERMAWVAENDVSLLLTIQSNGPSWVCDPEQMNERSCVYRDAGAFERYVSELLRRYPGEIARLQFGNEWASRYGYAGSAEDFVHFHNILFDCVQALSPETEVVLGGFASGVLTGWAFCAGGIDSIHVDGGALLTASDRGEACGREEVLDMQARIRYVLENANYDWVDLHFYDNVEVWPEIMEAFMEELPDGIPVLASEFGGPNLVWEQPYSDTFQAERLVEYIRTLNEMGIPEAYYFKLVQGGDSSPPHMESGLFELVFGRPVKKPAYAVFQAFSTGSVRP